jgi:membrane fusion protein
LLWASSESFKSSGQGVDYSGELAEAGLNISLKFIGAISGSWSATVRETLFRQEVLDEQRRQLLGRVLIQVPGTARGLVWFFTALFLVAAFFLFCGRYSRREVAIGVLVPNHGAIKVHVQRTGILSAIHVTEGQDVEQNQVLFSLSSDRVLPTGVEANQASIEEISSLIENLKARIDYLPQRQELELERLLKRQDELNDKLKLMKTQKALVEKRLHLKLDRKQRAAGLAQEKLISANEYQEIDDAVIKIQNEIQDAAQAIMATESEKREHEIRVRQLPDDFQKEKVELLQQLGTVKERLLALNLEKNQQIVAPVKGRVTSLQAYPGMNVDSQKPLAVLLPEGSHLEAHLFVPSRAIGFIKEGQKVLLQYEAFPVSKYGVQIGHIKEMSRTVLGGHEIYEMDLSGSQDSFYRLTVELEKASIQAFGQNLPLQSGIKARAEIILEQRSLLEWILEPLLRSRR